LRVIQEREVLRLGEDTPRRVDVRVVASTNRDLATTVREGGFREDLYFRLSVIPLRIPPLRERREDAALLVEHFCRLYGRDGRAFRVERSAMESLKAYDWPGNVRELENVVHRAVVLSRSEKLTIADFFPDEGAGTKSGWRLDRVGQAPRTAGVREGSRGRAGFSGKTINEAERLLIGEALEATGGNRTRAAQLVGISVRTLRNKLREYRQESGGQFLPTDS
jgi:DNA-binding NtrC family response regulator